MARILEAFRKLPLIEMLGIFICGAGLCFAIAGVGIAFDNQRAKKEKPAIQQSVEKMRSELIAGNVAMDQIDGLLRVHQSALVAQAVHQHFFITSLLVLLGLFTASFGFSLVLWGKLRALTRPIGRDGPQRS